MIEHVPRDHARLLTRVLERMFPDPGQRLQALSTLEQYGGDTQPEATRVRLAILKVEGADMARLQLGVNGAKQDYEDILAWAESPTETRLRLGNRKLTPHQWAEIAAQDQKQYEDWLHGYSTQVI